MSNFRTTADLLDNVLRRCGEVTSSTGTSKWRDAALLYLNQIHHTVVTGGNELNLDVDEPWVWSKSRHPIVIQLNPSITNGTVSLTQGSVAGTFSNVPTVNGVAQSVQNWLLRPYGYPDTYRISSHIAGSTSFVIDAPYPQVTSTANSYWLFQTDYDLVSSTINIDETNGTIDFSEDGTTQLTATIPVGGYAPAALATAAALAMTTASGVGNTYSGSYDSIQRYFTLSSNAANASVFSLLGAGTNYYRSGLSFLGFDFTTQSGALKYTSAYSLDAIVRLSQPARIFYGYQFTYGDGSDGRVGMLDPVAFDRMYPMMDMRMGTPDSFCLLREDRTGKIKVRFNKFLDTTHNMRVEFDHIPWPKDLFNNSASIPILPRKFIRILEFGAAFYLLTDKEDSRAPAYQQIAQAALTAMMRENRRELQRAGRDFGNVLARLDLTPRKRHLRLNIYGYDNGNF